MNWKKFNGFSLMEMMVVLLIVAIVLAASAPMISRKMVSGAGGEGHCLWQVVDSNGSIGYNMLNNNSTNNRSVIIGARRPFFMSELVRIPRLIINSTDVASPQIQLAAGPENHMLQDRKNIMNIQLHPDTLGLGIRPGYTSNDEHDSRYLGNCSLSIGVGTGATGDSSIAFGRSAAARGAGAIAIGTAGNFNITNQHADINSEIPDDITDSDLQEDNTYMPLDSFNYKDYTLAGLIKNTTNKINSILTGTKGLPAHATENYPLNNYQEIYQEGIFWSPNVPEPNNDDNGENSPENSDITYARGNTSIAIGYRTEASAGDTIAMGKIAKAHRYGAVAIGRESEATGIFTAAFGAAAKATGFSSLSIGVLSEASKDYATAVGVRAKATGPNSTAIGRKAYARHASTIAIGANAQARGLRTIAIGSKYYDSDGGRSNTATAFADDCIAIGTGATAGNESYGRDCVAMGKDADATGDMTTAVGYKAQATADEATAYGHNAQALGKNSVAIGKDAYASTDYSISIGDGATNYGKEDCIVIGMNARASKDNQVVLGRGEHEVDIPGNLTIHHSNTNLYALSIGESTPVFTVDKLGNVTVHDLKVTGDIIKQNGTEPYKLTTVPEGQGTLKWIPSASPSDRRLKNVGEVYKAGIAELKKLEFFHYTFKDDKNKTPRVGVMAQDLQKIFPDAVVKGEDGFLRIRLEDMFYAVINAVKELDSRLTALSEQVKSNMDLTAKLQAKIDAQQKEISELKKINVEFEKRLSKLEKDVK